MKKIFIYILIITPILIINALSDELVLTTELELCSEKNLHNYNCIVQKVMNFVKIS